jgi:hypothetical protein
MDTAESLEKKVGVSNQKTPDGFRRPGFFVFRNQDRASTW